MNRDEYFEEVDKFVDGIVEDIRSEHLKDRRSARVQVRTNASKCSIDICCAALMYGNFPCTNISKTPRDRERDLPFPFEVVGAPAFVDDVYAALMSRPAFRALPPVAKKPSPASPASPPAYRKAPTAGSRIHDEDEEEAYEQE